jgi:hypothetical protein
LEADIDERGGPLDMKVVDVRAFGGNGLVIRDGPGCQPKGAAPAGVQHRLESMGQRVLHPHGNERGHRDQDLTSFRIAETRYENG